MIIDFHTHCFSDSIAKTAIDLMEDKSGLKTIFDGTPEGLKQYMQSHGVDRSVVLPVATKPKHVPVINKWAKETGDDKLVFFGAIHPDDPDFDGTVQYLKSNGFRGVKLHADYQGFYADEPRMMPLYEKLREAGLILVMHTGLDNVYPVPAHCTPYMIRRIMDLSLLT